MMESPIRHSQDKGRLALGTVKFREVLLTALVAMCQYPAESSSRHWADTSLSLCGERWSSNGWCHLYNYCKHRWLDCQMSMLYKLIPSLKLTCCRSKSSHQCMFIIRISIYLHRPHFHSFLSLPLSYGFAH